MKLLSALVVDDSRSARYFLQRLLERNYCVVQTAESAEQAMERLTESAFDIVLLDYLLPGTNGFEVLDRIQRSRFRSRPAVIMCSSRQDREFIDQAILGGAAAILGKPADNEQLAQILADARIKRAIPSAEPAAPTPNPRPLLATPPAPPAAARPYVPPPPPPPSPPSAGLPAAFVSALESTLTPSAAREPALPSSLSLTPYGGEARVSEQAPKVLPDLPDIEAMLLAPAASGSLGEGLRQADAPPAADSAETGIDFAAEIDWAEDEAASAAPASTGASDGDSLLATQTLPALPEVEPAVLDSASPPVQAEGIADPARSLVASEPPAVSRVQTSALAADASLPPPRQADESAAVAQPAEALVDSAVAPSPPAQLSPSAGLPQTDSAVQAALVALQDEVRQLRQQVEQLPLTPPAPAPLPPPGPSLMDMRRLVHQMQDDLDKRFDQLLGSLTETQRLQRDADERLLASIERSPLAEQQVAVERDTAPGSAYSEWAQTVQINSAVDRERRQSRVYRVGFGLLAALGAMLFTLVFTQLRTAPTAMIAGAVIMLMAIVAGLALIHRAAENRNTDGEPH